MSDHAGSGDPDLDGDRPLDLLVWDAPNIDMTLSNVIGGRPTPASRPRFDAVADGWCPAWSRTVASRGRGVCRPAGGATQMRG